MSTYCCIYCRDDEECSGSGNRVAVTLAAFLRARPEIDALAATDAFGEIDAIRVLGVDSPDPLTFIAQHQGHSLVVRNEYGDEYDEQGMRVDRRDID